MYELLTLIPRPAAERANGSNVPRDSKKLCQQFEPRENERPCEEIEYEKAVAHLRAAARRAAPNAILEIRHNSHLHASRSSRRDWKYSAQEMTHIMTRACLILFTLRRSLRCTAPFAKHSLSEETQADELHHLD
jgi:hypothetical protein